MWPVFNPLNTELNPICHLLALLGAHHIFHVSGLRVNVQYLSLVFSHVTYGSCCNVLVYTTLAIFRLNEVEELHSPINQVRVGGVDHDVMQREGATARNNNL